jgi:hypothetical protein
VWWNDNPLFGGQVESILAFSFAGVLAAISRLAIRDVEQELTDPAVPAVAAGQMS